MLDKNKIREFCNDLKCHCPDNNKMIGFGVDGDSIVQIIKDKNQFQEEIKKSLEACQEMIRLATKNFSKSCLVEWTIKKSFFLKIQYKLLSGDFDVKD